MTYRSEVELEVTAPSVGRDVGELDDGVDVDMVLGRPGGVLVDEGNSRLALEMELLRVAHQRVVVSDGVGQPTVDSTDEGRRERPASRRLRAGCYASHQSGQQKESGEEHRGKAVQCWLELTGLSAEYRYGAIDTAVGKWSGLRCQRGGRENIYPLAGVESRLHLHFWAFTPRWEARRVVTCLGWGFQGWKPR